MIGVIDYGAGNLRSVTNALDYLELTWKLIPKPSGLSGCTRVILPGVGHFGSAMEELCSRQLAGAVRDWAQTGRPLLGVCVGAQMLMESSEEAPGVAGIGLLKGGVVRLRTRTIPHMGWNRAVPQVGEGLFAGNGGDEFFYFAHSYACAPECLEDVAAVAECEGQEICVAVRRGRVFGVQFHPEKSAEAGLALLGRFAKC